MDPVPRLGLGLAVVGVSVTVVIAGSGRISGLVKRNSAPCFGGRPVTPCVQGWFQQTHHAVGADPADQLDRQVAQDPGQTGDVIAGVADDHDMRVSGLPQACGDEPLDDTPQLDGGDCRRVVRRTEPHRVQNRGPGRGTRLQHRYEGVGPARNELRGCLCPAVDMAEQSLRRARHARAKPRRHIDRQDQAPQSKRGSNSPASTCRRPMSIRPWLKPPYIAPCPRRCSGNSVKSPPGTSPPRPLTTPRPPARTIRHTGRPDTHRTHPESAMLPSGQHQATDSPSRPSSWSRAPWSEHRIRRRPPPRPANPQVSHPRRDTIRCQKITNRNGAASPLVLQGCTSFSPAGQAVVPEHSTETARRLHVTTEGCVSTDSRIGLSA